MISLDSNVVIDILNGHPVVRERFRLAKQSGTLCLSALVSEEVRFGAEICSQPREEHAFLNEVLQGVVIEPFQPSDAISASKIRALLEKRGQRIGQVDALIAGHALCRGWTLVTANTRHFDRIEGLSLLDWRKPLSPEQDFPHA